MTQPLETRKIAVDFDGTIVEDAYPAIGRERPFALRTLRALQEKGFVLVLWTCRTGTELQEAIDFCQKGGVTFYGINENFAGEPDGGARKIDADIYIDDRNFGGLPSWGEIYHKLCGEDVNVNRQDNSSRSNTSSLSKIRRALLGK